jgi:hypothetical protein
MMFSYYLAKVASMMRIKIDTPDMNHIPVNAYVINLAVSGSGKGRSINIIEDQVLAKFKDLFIEQTFPAIAEDTLYRVAIKRANKNGTDPDTEMDQARIEFAQTGPMVFSFDSGTSAAVKQMRHKLLLAGIGSMNMEIDEIGSNLLGNMDVLTAFLELFDVGKIKQKLIKHTKDNVRTDELFGMTPANMLLFGTPTKLLDGAKTEDEFMAMLETGYARRCFFGFSRNKSMARTFTREEIYDIMTDVNADNHLQVVAERLRKLATSSLYNNVMKMSKDVTLELLDYRLHCERLADRMSEYEEVRKAELKHRYFKVAKMAGVYAFVDGSQAITEDHLYQAIALGEESGRAFEAILKRDRAYARLANYICSIGREVTQADLTEDLPFYKGTEANKRDMMTLAVAHGYKHNMIIKKSTVDGIEFYTGSSLPETSLDKLIFSFSKSDITKNYENEIRPWSDIEKLCTTPNVHWVNHHLLVNEDFPDMKGYRDEMHVAAGFNLVVLDCDDGTSVDTAKLLLEEYTYFLYTTKRSTPDKERFRIVFPISHVLEFDKKEYKEFMDNIFKWLPFEVDTQTGQRSRKWLSNPGQVYYNDGELLDALEFIPKTKKAEERRIKLANQGSLTALERWFINATEEGNRNNQLARFAFALVDMGYDLDSIRNNVLALNSKLAEPLSEMEVLSTVMQSAAKKIAEK